MGSKIRSWWCCSLDLYVVRYIDAVMGLVLESKIHTIVLLYM